VLAFALILAAPYALVHLTARPTAPALVVFTGLDTSPVYGTGEAFLTGGSLPDLRHRCASARNRRRASGCEDRGTTVQQRPPARATDDDRATTQPVARL
jgi:hypothetical protein